MDQISSKITNKTSNLERDKNAVESSFRQLDSDFRSDSTKALDNTNQAMGMIKSISERIPK